MILNLMPGLRDLRAPLAAGYVWLLVAWLLLHDNITTVVGEERGPLHRSLTALVDVAGPTGVSVAATFLAYIVGVVTTALASQAWRSRRSARDLAQLVTLEALNARFRSDADFWGRVESALSPGRLRIVLGAHRDLSRRLLPGSGEALSQAIKHSERWSDAQSQVVRGDLVDVARTDPELRHTILTQVLDTARLEAAIGEEIRYLPARLVNDHPSVYERWDRLTAETEFRRALVVPFAALAVVLLVQGSSALMPFWLLLFAVALVLLAGERQRRADEQLAEVMLSGIVTVRALEGVDTTSLLWRSPRR